VPELVLQDCGFKFWQFGRPFDKCCGRSDQVIETADQLFKLLNTEKIGMFQFIGIIRNTLKKEFRITPTERLAA
jgi:hypothetical protein